jgi:hypothetical protein
MNTMPMRLLAAVLLLVACASSASNQNLASRGEHNTLTRDQLAATNSDNLYDAIDKLRPEWLTSRGPTSATDPTPTQPSVYMNGQMLGRLGSLRELRLLDVTAVRYYPAGEASARFGMGHPRGVIEVTRQ